MLYFSLNQGSISWRELSIVLSLCRCRKHEIVWSSFCNSWLRKKWFGGGDYEEVVHKQWWLTRVFIFSCHLLRLTQSQTPCKGFWLVSAPKMSKTCQALKAEKQTAYRPGMKRASLWLNSPKLPGMYGQLWTWLKFCDCISSWSVSLW